MLGLAEIENHEIHNLMCHAVMYKLPTTRPIYINNAQNYFCSPNTLTNKARVGGIGILESESIIYNAISFTYLKNHRPRDN